jgi:8-amino-7-oxononanoate synthase
MLDIDLKLENYKKEYLYRVQKIHNESLINFTSNDYLSLTRDSRIKKVFKDGIDLYGLGSGSSAMISGYTNAHKELEQKFAAFLNRDAAILFNSGYHANLGLLSSLLTRNNHIVADKLCHASIIDGIKLSGAKLYRYKHNNLKHAEALLSEINEKKLLITESVFSMEGNIIAAPEIVKLALQYNTTFLIDDAHGIGVLGIKGGGICEYYDLDQNEVPYLIIPLGKALGSMGAIIAGKKENIEALRQFARTYIYTTALPPAIPYATIEILRIIEEESWRREKLNDLILFFIEVANEFGLNVISKDLTPIKSVIVGDNYQTLEIQKYLLEQGYYISCIRPPTVPKNTSRIRISINYHHTKDQIFSILKLIAMKIC